MPIAPPVSTDGSATAIPMLARTGSCRRCVRTGLSNPRWIPAATSKDARAASLSWITTTNSSPPVRETVQRPVREHLGLHPSVGDVSELGNEMVRCALGRSHQHDVEHGPEGLAVGP